MSDQLTYGYDRFSSRTISRSLRCTESVVGTIRGTNRTEGAIPVHDRTEGAIMIRTFGSNRTFGAIRDS